MASSISALRIKFLVFSVLLISGCASLPSPDELLSDSRARAPRFASSKGMLSEKQSQAILDGLQRRVGKKDIIERHLASTEWVSGSPLVLGNAVTLLEDGPATYRAMYQAIKKAKDHINIETYIIEDDEIGHDFANLLLEKQAQGVQVNLIYDSVGSISTPKSFFQRLEAAGIRTLEFNPVNPLASKKEWSLNRRDHRKIIIVDGATAFTGGINISAVYSGSGFSRPVRRFEGRKREGWRDTHVQIEGPVAAEFQKMFMETWEKQKGQPLAARNYFPPLKDKGTLIVRAVGSSADLPIRQAYALLLTAIMTAEDHIKLTMAYFVPDPNMLAALKDAAGRGVTVTLILPSFTDFWAVFHAGRSNYTELLNAGVRIYEHEGALLHAKTAIIDGVWSTVGSTNLDWRSFLFNDEVNAVVLGPEFAAKLDAMFMRDIRESREITLAEWEKRPIDLRFKEWAARLWERWL